MEFFVIFASLLAFSSVLEAQINEGENEKSGPSVDDDKRYEDYLLRRAKILDELDNLDKSIGAKNVSKSAEKITYEHRPQNESNESSHHNDVPASTSLDSSEDTFAPAPPLPPSTYSRIPPDHDHYPPQYHYYSSSSSSSYSIYPPYHSYPYPSSSSYSSMYPSSSYSQYPKYCYGCYSGGGYSGGYYPYQSSSWGGMPMGSNIFNMGLGWGLNMGIMGMPIGVGTGLGVNVG